MTWRRRAVAMMAAAGLLAAWSTPAGATTPYGPVAASSSTFSYFPLNDAAGAAASDAVAGETLPVVGTAPTKVASIAGGDPGQADQFTGSDGFAGNGAPTFPNSANNWTFNGWIEPTAVAASGSVGTIIDFGNPSTQSGIAVTLGTQSSNDAQIDLLENGRAWLTPSTSSVPLNKPTYVSITYSSSSGFIYYFNGVSSGSGSYPNPGGFDGSASIGMQANNARYFIGSLQDLGFEGITETAAQVQSDYAAYGSGASTGSSSGSSTGSTGSTGGSYTGPTAAQEGGFFSTLGGVFTGGLSSVAKAITGIGSSIVSAVTTVYNELSTIASDLVGWIEEAVTYLFVPTSSADPLSTLMSSIDNTEPMSTILVMVQMPIQALQGLSAGITDPGGSSLGYFDGQSVGNAFKDGFTGHSSLISTVRVCVMVFIDVFFAYGVFRTLMGVISKSKD